MALFGIKSFSRLDFGLPTNGTDSEMSEYTEVRKQLDKTKKRVKTLVNVIEAQNALLRRLARKIDPEDDMDQITPTVAEEQAAVGSDFFDGQIPDGTDGETPQVTAC